MPILRVTPQNARRIASVASTDFRRKSLPLCSRRPALYFCQIAEALQEEDVLK